MKNENRERCKAIADKREAIAEGRLYKCPDCGEYVEDNSLFCECGCQVDLIGNNETYPWEMVSFCDYFEDALDIDYITNSRKEYKACRIMVAFGGPNIYVNTWERKVELYWWTECESYSLSNDVCDAIDEWAEDYFNCM